MQTLQDNLIINELERVFDRKILFGQMASAAIQANPNMKIVFIRIVSHNLISGARKPVSNAIVGEALNWVYENKDLNLNITNAIRARFTGAISTDGFILKQQTEFVYNKDYQPELKYFSRDTNTIYPPALQFSWRDYTWNTGSSSQTILNTLPATLTLAQNPGVFFSQSVNRFRINARPEYPVQLWQTSSVYLNNYYLPTASYYAIKDLETNEFVINFDTQFTQLSADATSSYFDVYMNGLEPERYYAILIKSNIAGTTQVFDNQYYFKVING